MRQRGERYNPMDNLDNHLTPAQREAIAHRDGPLLVVAGPGSGKTAVIAHRTTRLLAAGVPARNLLVVTFTRAAAAEMKSRAEALAGRPAAGALFCTYHSLAYRILHRAEPGRRLSVLPEDAQFGILRALVHQLGLPVDEETVLTAQSEISRRANCADPAGFQPSGINREDFTRLLQGYAAEKQRRGVIDFDDLMTEAVRTLHQSLALLQRLRDQWQYLMVDEFQDTNLLQWELTRLLSEPRQNLCVVGDDDQAVYSWRGGSPDFLLDFPRVFPGCGVVKLEINHRCPAAVVKPASRLIARNTRRVEKRLQARPGSDGPAPQVLRPADSAAEATQVLQILDEGRRRGREYRDYAIIYRTHDQAHAVAQALVRAGIPCRTLGGLPNLYRRWVAQDVLAYLRLAAGDQDPALVAQIINRPNRYISRQALQAAAAGGGTLLPALAEAAGLARWQRERVVELGGHLRRLGTLTAPEAIAYVRAQIGYDDYIREYCEQKGGEVGEMLGLLAELAAGAPPVPVPAFLQQVESYGARRPETDTAEGDDAVTLVTCHRAKGLEFPVVILIGAVDGMMPHRSAETVEEERRLFYVAMTRTRAELYISAPRAREGREAKPSPFIAEAGLTDAQAPQPARAVPAGAPPGVPGLAARDDSLQPGTGVYHARYGRGRIESVDRDGGHLTVDFAGKRLSLDLQWCLHTPAFFRILPG